MTQRGRRSAAARAIADHSGANEAQRPAAPESLTDEQAEIWESTVEALPVDWFRQESLPILEAYCKHYSTAAAVSRRIDVMQGLPIDSIDLTELDSLSKLRGREMKMAESLATKLRITLQSAHLPDRSRKKKGADVQKGPWMQ